LGSKGVVGRNRVLGALTMTYLSDQGISRGAERKTIGGGVNADSRGDARRERTMHPGGKAPRTIGKSRAKEKWGINLCLFDQPIAKRGVARSKGGSLVSSTSP